MGAKKTVVNGIEIKLTAEDLDDYEITEALVDAEAPDATDGEKTRAYVRMMRLVFGDDFERVKSELRAKNGGKLTNETMTEFAAACFAAVGAKN